MVYERKNEVQTDIDLIQYIKDNKRYAQPWQVRKVANDNIQDVLSKSSKKGTDERGEPDLIYINDNQKLLILCENKASVKNHISKDVDKPAQFAVDGIKHYLSCFTKSKLAEKNQLSVQRYLQGWKIVGIAFSGDIYDEYNHRIDTFIVKNDEVENMNEKYILDEVDYIAYFENINLEKIANEISKSSKTINNLLRNLDSQKRPILLSALMICLYPKDDNRDFKNSYQGWKAQTIIRNIPITVNDILVGESIDISKIAVLVNELSFIKTDKDLTDTNALQDILKELENNVIPLFVTNTNYDIIGKFYEEFLRYAGVANVKKGIVLTPSHITQLFTEIIPMNANDVVFDPACGTGAFLIASMNKLVEIIEQSSLPNKKQKINTIKTMQLIGIEKSPTMYNLAVSNMLFRGDGKSQIFNEDFFSQEADSVIANLNNKPTIGLINPPFGGKDNSVNPTKKEIQFLEKLLDLCSRYVVIIAPISTYFKDEPIRTRVLTKHRLKYVINMPSDLFQPNASTHTAIAVFETNIPHGPDNKIVFFDLKEDGFVLSKNKGRTDPLNRWNNIKKDMLHKINNPSHNENQISLVYKNILEKDEWIIQAHAKTDYSKLSENNFIRSIKEYAIFSIKKDLDLLNKEIDELRMLEILGKVFFVNAEERLKNKALPLNINNFQEFELTDIFNIRGSKGSFTKYEVSCGEYLYITTSNKNNGACSTADIYTELGNVITVDSATDGKAFYQEYNFIGSDHVEILEPKNFILTKRVGIFLISILNLQQNRYSFGRKRSQTRLSQEKLYLPVKQDILGISEPDWQFMEDYIQSLPYSDNL